MVCRCDFKEEIENTSKALNTLNMYVICTTCIANENRGNNKPRSRIRNIVFSNHEYEYYRDISNIEYAYSHLFARHVYSLSAGSLVVLSEILRRLHRYLCFDMNPSGSDLWRLGRYLLCIKGRLIG